MVRVFRGAGGGRGAGERRPKVSGGSDVKGCPEGREGGREGSVLGLTRSPAPRPAQGRVAAAAAGDVGERAEMAAPST